ncbi:hypothetical protein HMF8227_02982 [Saliniradius amylolyticus]|uniref:Firmicu-CTERM sorting domain-containing protein n=1 Tax=Saliniradius amylolyticus TaxID=2183582 RepID=A0A2S2E895_9ALTE|nr:choice-of-anchor H family protein [Saliniradius amylolyticus]AWL13430.1 hypothetical protein HMF8227_02982 [Saliniradius amylolyticus]
MNTITSLFILSSLVTATVAYAESKIINTEITQAETRTKNKTPDEETEAGQESNTQHHYGEHSYIYDAWVSIERDQDYDGYASSFTLSMDIDSYYSSRWVYVKLSISDDLYHYQTYHVSSDIRVEGDSTSDVFSVETELAADFPPSDYSFAIELYDANTHRLLEVYDSDDDSDLLYVPLESREYDKGQSTVSIEAHGGSMGLAFIAVVAGVRLFRRYHKKH